MIRRTNKIIIFIIMVNAILVLFVINKQRILYSSKNEGHIQKISKKFSKIEKKLVNRKIKSIKSIIHSDTLKNEQSPYVIFMFSGNDCPGCIKKGFSLLKIIEESEHPQKVFVVSSNANTSIYQFNNNYYNYIYKDNGDLVKKELNYLFTPVFITIDSSFKILDLYFPLTVEPDSAESGYIKNLLMLMDESTG